jgi:hypothetical protein
VDEKGDPVDENLVRRVPIAHTVVDAIENNLNEAAVLFDNTSEEIQKHLADGLKDLPSAH